MKFAFEIKTKPVTQATIIIGIIAISSKLPVTIAIYLGSASVGIVYLIVLTITSYLVLHLIPRCLSPSAIFHDGIVGSANPPEQSAGRTPPHQSATPTYRFRPVGPLILQVFLPPGSSDPKEFYFDQLPDITQGSFTAVHAFFLANGHKVKMIKCPDLRVFAVGSIRHCHLPCFQPSGAHLC